MVVCEAWNAPFTFRYIDKEITTRIQCMQKLKDGKVRIFYGFLQILEGTKLFCFFDIFSPLNKR